MVNKPRPLGLHSLCWSHTLPVFNPISKRDSRPSDPLRAACIGTPGDWGPRNLPQGWGVSLVLPTSHTAPF